MPMLRSRVYGRRGYLHRQVLRRIDKDRQEKRGFRRERAQVRRPPEGSEEQGSEGRQGCTERAEEHKPTDGETERWMTKKS